MRTEPFIRVLPFLILSAILLQSCGNIDIVKRKHLPGFHVEMSKKEQRKTSSISVERLDSELTKIESKPATLEEVAIPESELIVEAEVASFNLTADSKARSSKPVLKASELVLSPFKELKREKLNGELRRAVFNNDDEKHGWSILSMVCTGTSVAALAMIILGLVFLVMLIGGGGFLYWWVFALVGMLLGIGGMVMGIVGLRQTRRGEKRGRGFALAGMIGGIVSLAAGIITLFWGLIYSLISSRSEDF